MIAARVAAVAFFRLFGHLTGVGCAPLQVMAKRTGGTPVAPKKPVPVAGAGAQKAGGGKKQKQKGLPVGKGKGNKGPKTPAAAKPSKEALDTDLDTYMAAPAPAQDAPAHGGVAAPMAE